MIYRILADITLILHFCFVIFVIFGGLLVLYRRFVLWIHLPALVWGVLIEFFRFTCPLTRLENQFRQLGGEAGYEGGFIEHYFSALLYWQMDSQTQILLGLALILINLTIYFFIFRRTQIRFANL